MLQGLQKFLDNANSAVIYISFGTVASNFPQKIISEIKNFVGNQNSSLQFVWKTDLKDWVPPSNVFIRKWMPQEAILCESCFILLIKRKTESYN